MVERTGDREHSAPRSDQQVPPEASRVAAPAAMVAGNAAVGRALGANGPAGVSAMLSLVGLAGNAAIRRTAVPGADADTVGDDLASQLASTRGGGVPLDPGVRDDLEQRLDTPLPPVRIHTDPPAARLARAVQAVAFTSGPDIYFSPGAYRPDTTAGRRLLTHEAVHTLQQAAGTGTGPLSISDPSDPFEREADRLSTAAGRPGLAARPAVQRQPDGDDPADILPPPRVANWSKDKFEITFARTGGTLNPRLEMTVRYVGSHKVFGDGTAKAVVSVGAKPLNAQVVSIDATGLSVDLYGDGRTVARLRDDARMSELPGGPGRSHVLNLWLDQRNVSSSSLTVFDPQASPADLTVAPKPEDPGANPVVQGLRFGADGWQTVIDADGDQDKELQLTLKTSTGAAGRTLTVTAVQRSSKEVRTATLPLPAGADSLVPYVLEVTDGRAPTKVQLFANPDPALLVAPGVHTADSSTYRLTLGGGGADLAFPAEKTPRRRIAAAEAARIAGGILATDITLGAYHDPFRLSFRQLDDGKTTFGLSALNGGAPRDTVGAELTLPGPIRYTVLDGGPTSLAIDLDGDGKANLQIFDRLTTPADYDGGGPPAQSRNHQIRVVGPAIGAERTYQYQYRFGALNGVNSMSGAVNTEAGRNAEAVASLAEQAKTTTLEDTLDQIEIAMLSMRRRAAERGLLARAVFDKNLALWQVLVRLRAQVAKGVPPALRDEAVKAAGEFAAEAQKDVPEHARVIGMVPEALRTGNWAAGLFMYSAATAAIDGVLRTRMEKAGGESDKDLVEARQLGQLRSELKEIPGGKAIRVAGTYHPDEKFRTEQGYVSMVPLQLYVWKEDDEWQLKDVTNPDKPYTYSYEAKPGETLPPLAVFTRLDDPDHFPSGAINIQVPGGQAGRVNVRDRMTWKKFFTYLGVSLAVVGLTLATIASAGATSAAVPAAWALGASALAGATAAGIDLVEHIQQDNLDARTAILDLAQIAAGVATAGGLAAGRIVVAAGSAPAAARWSGAWAQAARLAQRAYVPMVVGAGVADVVTVAVMAEGTLRQLDEIEKGTADPADKSRAKLLLLIQAATMAGLTALQFKGMGPLGRGETLVLSPGPDGLPVVSPAVRTETVIVDAQIAIALKKRARIEALKPGETLGPREALQKGEIELLKRYDAMNPADTRIADASITETAGPSRPGPQRGFAVGASRTSPEYQELFKELERANVGKGKGDVDRQIVGDAFFAVGERGVTPKLATMDPEIYKKLYALKVTHEGAEPLLDLLRKHAKKGQASMPGLPEIFPEGFTVTIKTPANPAGRTLHVLPMPKEVKSGLAPPKP